MDNHPTKKLILVVDDQANNLKVISSVLGESYTLSFANNGTNALKILSNLTPDLVLLDVMMPEMDGYEVCRHIKSNEKTKDIPVIFLTAKTDIEDIVKAFSAGAVDYITKPFNIMELKVRVSNHILLRQAHQALEISNEQLLKANQEKDKFFSIIAHDLRNPFIGIASLSKIMKDQLKELGQPELEEFADEINKAASNAYNLLKNLLNWARSATGRMEFDPAPVGLYEMVDEAMALQREIAASKGIQLINNTDAKAMATADREMLNVVVRNLLSNAVKFTKSGGSVTASSTMGKNEICLHISDTGIGMNEKMIADLFRLDASTGRKGTGGEPSSGLGLILCKEFVERNAGTIHVQSEVGKGSTFSICLPLA